MSDPTAPAPGAIPAPPASAAPPLDAYLRRRLGLMTETELSELLGVQPRTVQSWRLDGKGPSWVRVGHTILFHEDDVQEWLKLRVEHSAEVRFGRDPRGNRNRAPRKERPG